VDYKNKNWLVQRKERNNDQAKKDNSFCTPSFDFFALAINLESWNCVDISYTIAWSRLWTSYLPFIFQTL